MLILPLTFSDCLDALVGLVQVSEKHGIRAVSYAPFSSFLLERRLLAVIHNLVLALTRL